MDRIMYYDKYNKPIDDIGAPAWKKWSCLFEDRNYSKIAETNMMGCRISTVWLGLDHNWGGGDPLIFETMVFPIGYSDELDMERYTTLHQAEQGHERMVEKWRKRWLQRFISMVQGRLSLDGLSISALKRKLCQSLKKTK